jgi:hypothetical protein
VEMERTEIDLKASASVPTDDVNLVDKTTSKIRRNTEVLFVIIKDVQK